MAPCKTRYPVQLMAYAHCLQKPPKTLSSLCISRPIARRIKLNIQLVNTFEQCYFKSKSLRVMYLFWNNIIICQIPMTVKNQLPVPIIGSIRNRSERPTHCILNRYSHELKHVWPSNDLADVCVCARFTCCSCVHCIFFLLFFVVHFT